MPGRRRIIAKNRLRFELSAGNLEFLATKFPEQDLANVFEARWREILAQREAEQRVCDLKHLPPEAFQFEFKTVPYEHQKKAFWLSKDLEIFAYLMEMGTGKSKVLLDVAAYLWSTGAINGLLLLSPKGVHAQWVKEQIPNHLPDWVPREVLLYKPNTPSRVLKAINELVSIPDKLRILSMNIEALQSESGLMYAREFLGKTTAMMAIDESTRIKSPGAIRTKHCFQLAPMARYRRILTGSPITKGLEDLFAQLKFLDPDVLGYTSFYTFRNHFCIMGGFENKAIVAYKNQDELTKKLEGISFRVRKEECLDLPAKIYQTREIEMGKEQAKLYKSMKDDLIMQIDNKLIEATQAIVQLTRLQQIGSNIVPDPANPGKVLRLPGENPRIEAIKEILEEVGGAKTIIWSKFTAEIDWLMEELGRYGAVRYDGTVDSKQREENKRLFKTSPAHQLFIGNQQAGGTGLDLPEASVMIYCTNTFNAESRWQSEDRAHRIGQKDHLTIIDLIMKGTTDTKIVAALRRKKNIADSVVDIKKLLEEPLLSETSDA